MQSSCEYQGIWNSWCPPFGGPAVSIKALAFGSFPLKMPSPQTLLVKCPSGVSPALSPDPPESYLEYPFQRLHIAAFALHDGAQDVPPDHLLGQKAQSAPVPTMAQSELRLCAEPRVMGRGVMTPSGAAGRGTEGTRLSQSCSWNTGAWQASIPFQRPCQPQTNARAPQTAAWGQGTLGLESPAWSLLPHIQGWETTTLLHGDRRPPPSLDNFSRKFFLR